MLVSSLLLISCLVQAQECNPLIMKHTYPKETAERIDVIVHNIVPIVYRKTVLHYSILYSVPPHLIAAVIDQETNGTWNPFVISKKNYDGSCDIGLAQANSNYLKMYKDKYGLIDPMNYKQSISFCCQYMRYLYDNSRSWLGALIAYKCGLMGRPTFKVIQGALFVLNRIDAKETL